MSALFFPFTVGVRRCLVVQDFARSLALDEWFLEVPPATVAEALRASGLPEDSVEAGGNCLYLETEAERVLVDAGYGNRGPRQGHLLAGLQAAGVDPAEVSLVVLTHTDSDHIYGLLDTAGEPVYPNARYVMGQAGWEALQGFDWDAQGPDSAEFGRQLLDLLGLRLRPVADGVEFLPGMRLIPLYGHRPGHCGLEIVSHGEHLLHVADGLGHPLMVAHPEWRWRYDSDPAQAAADKARWYSWAYRHGALVFGAHLPFPGLGHVVPSGDGWRWQAIVNRPN